MGNAATTKKGDSTESGEYLFESDLSFVSLRGGESRVFADCWTKEQLEVFQPSL